MQRRILEDRRFFYHGFKNQCLCRVYRINIHTENISPAHPGKCSHGLLAQLTANLDDASGHTPLESISPLPLSPFAVPVSFHIPPILTSSLLFSSLSALILTFRSSHFHYPCFFFPYSGVFCFHFSFSVHSIRSVILFVFVSCYSVVSFLLFFFTLTK